MASKFIIIDQSLQSLCGHHHEYTSSVAKAAYEQGYEVLVFCNKNLGSLPHNEGVRYIPWFTHDWIGSSEAKAPSVALKILLKLFQMPLEAHSQLVKCLGVFLVHIQRRDFRTLQRTIASIVLRQVSAFFRKMRSWARFALTNSPKRSCKKLLSACFKVRKIRSFIRLCISDNHKIRSAFYNEIALLIKKHALSSRDQIFIHTIATPQLRGLQEYVLACDIKNSPYFHVLLRRRIDEELNWFPNGLNITGVIERFSCSGLHKHKLSFYTDTDGLSQKYSALSRIAFETVPIPFKMPVLSAESKETNQTLNITYLGDARREKGFQHLPHIVSAILSDERYKARVKFTFQSNYNSKHPDELITNAISQLQNFPDKVQLIDTVLSDEEYYQLLHQSDIVLLPYDAVLYGDRSSGVLSQAIAAGKVAVVPADTWMAEQISGGRGVTYTSVDELLAATRFAIDHFATLHQEILRFAQTWREFHTAKSLVEQLVKNYNASSSHPRTGRDVLYFFESYLFGNSGGVRVHEGQIKYFKAKGDRIHAVMLCTDFFYEIQKPKYLDSIDEMSRAFGFTSLWVLFPDVGLLEYLATVGANNGAFFSSRHFIKSATIPRDLAEKMHHNGFDLVFVNYAKNGGIIEKLGLQHVQSVCEMHDLISRQHFSHQKIGDEALFKEIEELSLFSKVLSISSEELDIIKPHLGSKAFYMPPYNDIAPSLISTKPYSSWELLQHAKPENALPAQPFSLDILFIGSAHSPNIQGIMWFIEHVFEPYLAPKGFHLAIAGKVCNHLSPSHDHIHLLGVVQHLDMLYAASQTVVVPLLEGTGVSIKTIEAMLMEKPIVATKVGVRGVHTSSVIVSDIPETFANELESLLLSADKRQAIGKDSRQEALKHHSWEAYQNTLDRVLMEDAA